MCKLCELAHSGGLNKTHPLAFVIIVVSQDYWCGQEKQGKYKAMTGIGCGSLMVSTGETRSCLLITPLRLCGDNEERHKISEDFFVLEEDLV